MDPYAGSPSVPTGNPLKDGIGPAAYAQRADYPDQYADGALRIVPMKSDDHYSVATFSFSRDPIGMEVTGADGKKAGKVVDLWVDRAESIARYLEIKVKGGNILAPIAMAVIHKDPVEIDAINASDFAGAPKLASKGQVTRLEEDKICGYFGGGYLYANEARAGTDNMMEYDSEPIRGLPGELPEGERILWQGSPDWRVFVRSALFGRWIVGYFAILAFWSIATGSFGGAIGSVVAGSLTYTFIGRFCGSGR